MDPVGNDAQYFGDGLNWRHSYQWSMTIASSNSNGVTAWAVNYPDGSSVVYQAPNTTLYPNETFWRGMPGTKDRLDLSNSSMPILHTNDGGQVVFANSYRATSIIDPNGATTTADFTVIERAVGTRNA